VSTPFAQDHILSDPKLDKAKNFMRKIRDIMKGCTSPKEYENCRYNAYRN
jgi:hypothetical protein